MKPPKKDAPSSKGENNDTNSSLSGLDNKTDDEKLDAFKSKATRYIFLVRHGQYNLEGEEDQQRNLTPLGKFMIEILVIEFNVLIVNN